MSPVAVRRGYSQAVEIITVAVLRRGFRRGPSWFAQVLEKPTVAVPVVVVRPNPHTPLWAGAPLGEGAPPCLARKESTMLTDHNKAAALEIVLAAKDPEDFPIINDRLCREFPEIQTDDLIALWREAGEKQLAEADALEAWAEKRFAH